MRPVDGIVVRLSSIMIVGSVLWGPFIAYSFLKRIMKKYKVDPTARKRILIAGAFASLVIIFGPHRKRKVGEWLNVRNWKLWDSWMRFVSYTVIQDLGDKEDDEGFSVDLWTEQAILSIIPHGIFPFGLGLAALPADAVRAFGLFRVVIASATNLFPIVSTVCSWLDAVDASKSSVNSALAAGDSIGLAPGGIAEMFEGYPKVGCEPNDEVALLMKRKGFVKMAIQHGLPIIPCYTFGATKMFKRLDLPLLEKISNFLRISLCIFFGKFGLVSNYYFFCLSCESSTVVLIKHFYSLCHFVNIYFM